MNGSENEGKEREKSEEERDSSDSSSSSKSSLSSSSLNSSCSNNSKSKRSFKSEPKVDVSLKAGKSSSSSSSSSSSIESNNEKDNKSGEESGSPQMHGFTGNFSAPDKEQSSRDEIELQSSSHGIVEEDVNELARMIKVNLAHNSQGDEVEVFVIREGLMIKTNAVESYEQDVTSPSTDKGTQSGQRMVYLSILPSLQNNPERVKEEEVSGQSSSIEEGDVSEIIQDMFQGLLFDSIQAGDQSDGSLSEDDKSGKSKGSSSSSSSSSSSTSSKSNKLGKEEDLLDDNSDVSQNMFQDMLVGSVSCEEGSVKDTSVGENDLEEINVFQGVFENVLCEKAINPIDDTQRGNSKAESDQHDDIEPEYSSKENETVKNLVVEILTKNIVPHEVHSEGIKFSYDHMKINSGESASESNSRRSSSEKNASENNSRRSSSERNLSETVSSHSNEMCQEMLQGVLTDVFGGSLESLSASLENLSEEDNNIYNDIFQDILAGNMSLEDAQKAMEKMKKLAAITEEDITESASGESKESESDSKRTSSNESANSDACQDMFQDMLVGQVANISRSDSSNSRTFSEDGESLKADSDNVVCQDMFGSMLVGLVPKRFKSSSSSTTSSEGAELGMGIDDSDVCHDMFASMLVGQVNEGAELDLEEGELTASEVEVVLSLTKLEADHGNSEDEGVDVNEIEDGEMEEIQMEDTDVESDIEDFEVEQDTFHEVNVRFVLDEENNPKEGNSTMEEVLHEMQMLTEPTPDSDSPLDEVLSVFHSQSSSSSSSLNLPILPGLQNRANSMENIASLSEESVEQGLSVPKLPHQGLFSPVSDSDGSTHFLAWSDEQVPGNRRISAVSITCSENRKISSVSTATDMVLSTTCFNVEDNSDGSSSNKSDILATALQILDSENSAHVSSLCRDLARMISVSDQDLNSEENRIVRTAQELLLQEEKRGETDDDNDSISPAEAASQLLDLVRENESQFENKSESGDESRNENGVLSLSLDYFEIGIESEIKVTAGLTNVTESGNDCEKGVEEEEENKHANQFKSPAKVQVLQHLLRDEYEYDSLIPQLSRSETPSIITDPAEMTQAHKAKRKLQKLLDQDFFDIDDIFDVSTDTDTSDTFSCHYNPAAEGLMRGVTSESESADPKPIVTDVASSTPISHRKDSPFTNSDTTMHFSVSPFERTRSRLSNISKQSSTSNSDDIFEEDQNVRRKSQFAAATENLKRQLNAENPSSAPACIDEQVGERPRSRGDSQFMAAIKQLNQQLDAENQSSNSERLVDQVVERPKSRGDSQFQAAADQLKHQLGAENPAVNDEHPKTPEEEDKPQMRHDSQFRSAAGELKYRLSAENPDLIIEEPLEISSLHSNPPKKVAPADLRDKVMKAHIKPVTVEKKGQLIPRSHWGYQTGANMTLDPHEFTRPREEVVLPRRESQHEEEDEMVLLGEPGNRFRSYAVRVQRLVKAGKAFKYSKQPKPQVTNDEDDDDKTPTASPVNSVSSLEIEKDETFSYEELSKEEEVKDVEDEEEVEEAVQEEAVQEEAVSRRTSTSTRNSTLSRASSNRFQYSVKAVNLELEFLSALQDNDGMKELESLCSGNEQELEIVSLQDYNTFNMTVEPHEVCNTESMLTRGLETPAPRSTSSLGETGTPDLHRSTEIDLIQSQPALGNKWLYGRNLSPFIYKRDSFIRKHQYDQISDDFKTLDFNVRSVENVSQQPTENKYSTLPSNLSRANIKHCVCCDINRNDLANLKPEFDTLIAQYNDHADFTLFTMLELSLFMIDDDRERREAIEVMEQMDGVCWDTPVDLGIYRTVVKILYNIYEENKTGAKHNLRNYIATKLTDLLSLQRDEKSRMPDQVLGSHLLLEEERRRFRNTVDQLEKQREEAQDEVDELINALRRERDLGDEEIIFLKAQLRGLKYNLGDPEETKEKIDAMTQENEDLKDELKKEAYKRKKLKERFIELQSLVNDESVVLVQEIEKRDEEIAELKEELQDAKDAINTSEEAEKTAQGKEERLLEECERLNVTVEHLESQLKIVQRDIFTYKIILEEKGVNTEDEKKDELVEVKTQLEEEVAAKEDLQGQLEEVKKAVEEAEKDLVEDIERKEKMIQQLKRTIDDKEYLYKTREYQLFTENEELKGDIEALKEQLNDQINNPDSDAPTDIGVPQDKYDQLLAEMDREQKERKKLQNHFKDLKSYVDKDTADLVNEVQKRDEVIESMNEKLNDLDNLERTEAELDYERKQRKIDEMRIAELRAAISKDKLDIVTDSEKKSDMIRQLKSTLTDAKTNLERARWKQREIIMDNQKLRETNLALQKALDEKLAGAGPSDDRKVKELTDELKEINRDLEKEKELRGQLAGAMQALKETLSEDEADLVDEINKRDIIIANLQNQLREDTARLSQQVTNHRRKEDELLNDYDAIRDRIAEAEVEGEPIGHHPAIKDLERDMFEDLTRWMTEEVRILETGVRDRVNQIDEMVPLLTSNTGFDQERVHYVKELAAQEAEINDLRHLNQQMQAGQSDSAHNYESKLSEMADEIADLRKQLGRPVLVSEPIHGSNDSLPIMAMINTQSLEESGLGMSLSTTMDVVDGVRATPPGQAGEPTTEVPRGRSDETVEKELIGQLRQIYSNLDMCRQDINRTVESFHDRMVRHHPRLQRRDSPSRLDKKNIGHTINSLLEGYHTQVTELITRLNTDSNTLGRRNENLDEVVQQLESNLNQERQRYDQLHSRTKSYRQEIQELRAKLRDQGNAAESHMDGEHANHDLCQAVHELLNDIDGAPGESRGRTPSIQEFSRLLLPQAAAAVLEPLNEAGPSDVQRTPEGLAFKEDCDVIQEKTTELNELVKGLQERLDAQKQARIEALQGKVKEYEAEMDRLRDIIGNESEKDNEIEALRERNRQMALNLRDTKSELDTEERKNATLTDKFNDSDNARKDAVDELGELRRKTREREAYIRQLQENLRNADDRIEEKEADNGQLRADCAELQQKSSQLSSLIKEVETKFVEKSRQYTILERELEMLKEKSRAIQDYADKRNAKIEEMEQDLRDLINENEKLQTENAEANDETKVAQEKVKELESRLANREELIADLEKASEQLAEDVEKRDQVLKEMHNEIQKLEEDLEKKEEAMKGVEDELDKQDAEMEAMEEDNKLKEAAIDKMSEEVEKMKEDIEEVEKTVKEKDDIINELKDAVTSIEKDLDQVKEKEKEVEADLEEAERELDVAHKNEEELEEQLEDVKNKADEKQAALDKLADDCDQLKQYIKDLEDTLKEEKAENDDLVKETEDQKDRLDEQEGDLKRLADIVTDLEKELEDEQSKTEDLKDENEELKAELADLAKQKQDILDEVNHAMEDMEGEREEYKTTLADLKDYLEAQQNDVKELKQQLVEKPELEHRCMQTDVQETRSARQQTDEPEVMNVRIQTIIEEPKTPMRSRRVQTEQDPLDELRANAVKTVIKSSSLHVLRQMYNTQDTDTQTNARKKNRDKWLQTLTKLREIQSVSDKSDSKQADKPSENRVPTSPIRAATSPIRAPKSPSRAPTSPIRAPKSPKPWWNAAPPPSPSNPIRHQSRATSSKPARH